MSSTPSPRRCVVLTRQPPDNDALAERLERAGFEVLEWPAVATRWLRPPGGVEALRARLVAADWVVFTSRRAVEALSRLLPEGLVAALAGRQAAAVGPATAARLEAEGLPASLVAQGRGWEELSARLGEELPSGARVLLSRSAAADWRLPAALVARGLVVDDLRLHGPGSPAPRREPEQPLAVVVCASPTAAGLLLDWNPWAASTSFVAIGPTTAEALRAKPGLRRVVVAASPSTDDLLAAVLTAARDEEPSP